MAQLELSIDNQDFTDTQNVITHLEQQLDSKSPQFVELLVQKSRYFESIEDNNLSEEVCRQAIQLGITLDNPVVLARAYSQLAFTLYISLNSINFSKEQKDQINKDRSQAMAEASKILNKIISDSNSGTIIDDLLLKTQALFIDYQGLFKLEQGFPSQAIELFKKALEIAKKINYVYVIIVALNNMAACYLQMGQFEEASQTIDDKIKLVTRIGNAKELTQAYSIKGDIYRELGQLEKALETKKLILDLGTSLNRPFLVSYGMGAMASIYFEMGDFKQAKDFFNQSVDILRKNFGDKRRIILRKFIQSLGIIDRYEMKYDLALIRFRSALEFLDSDNEKISVFFELIVTLLEINKPEAMHEARVYLEIMNEINQKYTDYPDNVELYNLAKALMLNKSPHLENKFQAKQILKELEKSAILPKNQLLASQAIIDILLYELKASSDKEILKNLKSQIEKVYLLSQKQKRFNVMIDSFLLQSKVEIVEGNYQKAFELLEQAEKLCQDKNLQPLTTRIKVEKEAITNYIEIFNEQMKSNLSIIKKIEVVQFEDYLIKAKKFLSDSMEDQKTSNTKIL